MAQLTCAYHKTLAFYLKSDLRVVHDGKWVSIFKFHSILNVNMCSNLKAETQQKRSASSLMIAHHNKMQFIQL